MLRHMHSIFDMRRHICSFQTTGCTTEKHWDIYQQARQGRLNCLLDNVTLVTLGTLRLRCSIRSTCSYLNRSLPVSYYNNGLSKRSQRQYVILQGVLSLHFNIYDKLPTILIMISPSYIYIHLLSFILTNGHRWDT